MLAIRCEALMQGSVVIENETIFINQWEQLLSEFDQNAFELSEKDPQLLFENVTVCGNCYAVCKKLENLLKTYLVRKRRNETITGGEAMCTDLTQIVQVMQSTVKCYEKDDQQEILVNLLSFRAAITPEVHLDDNNDNNNDKNHDSDGNDDNDDDGSIVPVYKTLSNTALHSAVDIEDLDKGSDVFNGQSTAVPSTLKSTTRLSDYYPHIGMIFPVAYSQIDSRYSFYVLLLIKLMLILIFYYLLLDLEQMTR